MGESVQKKGISEHLYSVRDVCMMTGITRKTLFYYDKVGLLVPDARIGTQAHKAYHAETIERLKLIIAYRNAGIHIQEIKRLFSADNQHEYQNILTDIYDRMEKEMNLMKVNMQAVAQLMKTSDHRLNL